VAAFSNAARMIENLADYSHFPFVHPGTLGDPENPQSEPITIEPLDGGFQYDIPQPVNRLTRDNPARQTYKLYLPFRVPVALHQRFKLSEQILSRGFDLPIG